MHRISVVRSSFLAVLSLWPLVGKAAGSAGASGKDDPYLAVVRRTADCLLDNARDVYGPVHSGMILSVLDRKTGKPVERLPKAPAGVRSEDRTGPGGSNASVQPELYRSLNHLSRLTGDPRYADASKQAVVDFVRITQHPVTGLLAWGEHTYWDCILDQAGTGMGFVHEPKRKFVAYKDLLNWDQPRALKYAQGLWDHQIGNKKTGDFTRHAHYDKHAPGLHFDFPKEGSFFIDTWSQAYAATKDAAWITPVQVLANRYLGRMNSRGLLDFDTSGIPERVNWSVSLANLSLAAEAFDAKPRMDPETGAILQKLYEGIDRGFLALKHEISDPSKGFMVYAFTNSGEPFPLARKKSLGYSPAWGLGYGIHSTSMMATLCYTRQAQLGKSGQGEAYRKLFLEAAKVYQTAAPNPVKDDIWSGEYGMAILTELGAYRLTNDASFLKTARSLGDEAIRVFWSNDAPLPRASSKTDYYDAMSYSDTLILSLLALHEAVTGIPPQVEISDTIR